MKLKLIPDKLLKTKRSETLMEAVVLTLLLISLSINALYAQDAEPMMLSLQEAIELVKTQNTEVLMAGHKLDANRAQLRQTSAAFLPQLSFEYNAISTNDPLNVFGFRLKQQSVTMQDFDPDRLNDPDTYENFSAKLEVRQPVFNPDMLMKRSAVKNSIRSAGEQFKAVQSQKSYEVRDLYYRLQLMDKQVEVINAGLKTASEHYRQAAQYFEEGMISRADMLAARVYELNMQSRLIQTEHELDGIRESLAYSLGLSSSTIIHASDDLAPATEQAQMALTPVENIDNSMLRTIDYQAQAAEDMVKSARFSYLPRINLFGSYEFNDSDAFGFGSNAYMVGANLSWSLFSGLQNSGKVMEARANQRKSQTMLDSYKTQMSNQLKQAQRMLQHAEFQLDLSGQTIEQASEDVRIRTNRFAEGIERTTDLLQAETVLLEARLHYFKAIYQYNLSLSSIEMILETEF